MLSEYHEIIEFGATELKLWPVKDTYVHSHTEQLLLTCVLCCVCVGAGKTTLISVLTGLYEPTSGQARIAGYNIATDISSVHTHMGVCPQFDIQHASLTSEEHLLFYARLKGVRPSREAVVVEKALRQVLATELICVR